MPAWVFFFFGVLLWAYASFSKRLTETPLTGALLFFLAGVALGPLGLGGVTPPFGEAGRRIMAGLAEASLLFVLFSDASRVDLEELKREQHAVLRLLVLGIPYMVGLGAVTAHLLFGDWNWTQALLLGAVLAPTDAALGLAVVQDPRLPLEVRQTLNVESGLNDGLCLPFVLTALAWGQDQSLVEGARGLFERVLWQASLGPLAGVLVAWVFARGMEWALRRDWMESEIGPLGVASVPIAAYGLAEWIGGNGFLSTFVAGMVFGTLGRKHREESALFAERFGLFLTFVTFSSLGAILLPELVFEFGPRDFAMGFLSLAVLRPISVWTSLLGTRIGARTRLFYGWFGPRGLASILFALYVLESVPEELGFPVYRVVLLTVVASILLHGVSAAPLAKRASRALSKEHQLEEEPPARPEAPLS